MHGHSLAHRELLRQELFDEAEHEQRIRKCAAATPHRRQVFALQLQRVAQRLREGVRAIALGPWRPRETGTAMTHGTSTR